MQLVSNVSQTDDISETEPILGQSNNDSRSEEASSSIEIRTVGRVTANDFQSDDVDENCSLVNSDHPQCRICLDNGG